MTYEEVKKIPFHFVSHLSMENEHTATYADDSGRLGFCDITKKKGFKFGKSRRVFRIDGTWYETKEEFIEGLKSFAFGPQPPIVTDLNIDGLSPVSCQDGNILEEEEGGFNG